MSQAEAAVVDPALVFVVYCPCCAVQESRTVGDDGPCNKLCLGCRGPCLGMPYRPSTVAGMPTLVSRPLEDPIWTRQP